MRPLVLMTVPGFVLAARQNLPRIVFDEMWRTHNEKIL